MTTGNTTVNIRDLVSRLAAAEERARHTEFLAPCLRRGRIRMRVDGLVRLFVPCPSDFEGWGVFRVDGEATARLSVEADLGLVDRYLRLLPAFRLWLARRLQGRSWIAVAANQSDARQRIGRVGPIAVHLVEGGAAFEGIVARYDGAAWWYESADERSDPTIAEQLRATLRDRVDPSSLEVKGLTPEMREAYALAVAPALSRRKGEVRTRRESDLERALSRAGARLLTARDQGDYWNVDWMTPSGEEHTAAIHKNDLTVISAGICLSGQDRLFDLQSLVRVVEEAPDWS